MFGPGSAVSATFPRKLIAGARKRLKPEGTLWIVEEMPGLLVGAEDGGFRPARAVLLDLADLITAPLTAGQDPGFAIPRMG